MHLAREPAILSAAMPLDPEACWDAVTRRDRAADGRFVFGVRTTGIYCRPSCPARRPLRENVRFYPTPAQARDDGLRACLRCQPDLTAACPAWILDLCRHIRAACDDPTALTLPALAARVQRSPAHVQRAFRALVGVSPREYAERCRLDQFRGSLRRADSVTGAIYDAGFGSSSRVYERNSLGMTPGEYRAGGKGVAITHAAVTTSLGLLLIAATDRGLCSVQFGDCESDLLAGLRREYPHAVVQPMADPPSPAFAAWIAALRRHIDEGRPHPDLPLDVRASAFQTRVWNFLRQIPPGETRSYADVAAGIGAPTATRAVARACATNTVALAIPCHRVIRAGGDLSGYRWGPERKRQLLVRERAARSRAESPAPGKSSQR